MTHIKGLKFTGIEGEWQTERIKATGEFYEQDLLDEIEVFLGTKMIDEAEWVIAGFNISGGLAKHSFFVPRKTSMVRMSSRL